MWGVNLLSKFFFYKLCSEMQHFHIVYLKINILYYLIKVIYISYNSYI